MAPAIAGPSLSIEYTLVTLDGVFEDPQIRAPGDALAGRARQPGHHRRLDTRHPLASVTASSRLAASTSQLGGGADLTERGPVQDRLGGIDDAVAMPATKPAHAALAALSVPGTRPAGW
jgi:hypothetical protein